MKTEERSALIRVIFLRIGPNGGLFELGASSHKMREIRWRSPSDKQNVCRDFFNFFSKCLNCENGRKERANWNNISQDRPPVAVCLNLVPIPVICVKFLDKIVRQERIWSVELDT